MTVDLAIIVSTIPVRHNLLLRSIETWQHSIEASGLDCSINIYSEGCPAQDLFSIIPDMQGINIAGQEDFSGSPEKGSNYWMERIEAKVYCFVHPEIMLPTNAIRVAFDSATPKTYCTFRVLWMPQYITEHLDEYNWMPPERLETCSDLYQYGPTFPPSRYLNLNVRENAWESDTCWSMCSDDIHQIFPIPVFGFWGPIDCLLAGERSRLGIQTYNPPDPVLHQWHPKIEGRGPGEAVEAAHRELIKKYGR